MTGRSVLAGVLASAVVAAVATAQNTRTVERAPNASWNALLAADTSDDAPTVELRLENGPSYSYGSPVRVRFRVSDDAYVIVARVNANGHLTLLYPSSRLTTSEVRGGMDVEVRGRRGPGAFYADDRMGGGFIFAVASYDPFVLTRLGLRDFDRYVTGTYVGRPTQVYVGDPHSVITRFVNMVSFSDASPFDYAVEFYNVDAPYFVTSAGYSSYCSGYSRSLDYNDRYWYRPTLDERWDDDFYGYYGRSSYGCNPYPPCAAYNLSSFGYSSLYTSGIAFFPLCYQQNNNGNPPVQPPGSDSLKVPRWLTDSVGGRTPDTVGVIPVMPTDDTPGKEKEPNTLRRSTTGTEGPRRPVVIADDPSDNSYSIPGRALRNSPMTLGQTRDPSTGAPLDRPDRRSANASDGTSIDWVRPPREVVRAPLGNDNEFLPRSPRQRGNGSGIDRSRGNGSGDGGYPSYVNTSNSRGGGQVRAEPPRFDPPTRTQGPRFDSPRPTERSNGSDVRYAEPPHNSGSPRFDSPRPVGGGASSSGGDRGSAGSAPSRVEHTAPPPRPAPVAPPVTTTSSGEKKPEKP